VYAVISVLYLQFVLHVMLFRPWNVFCTSALALFYYYYYHHIIIIIIIIIIIVVVIIWLTLITVLFSPVPLLNQRQSPPLTLPVSHCNTFRFICDVPSTAVFCAESTDLPVRLRNSSLNLLLPLQWLQLLPV
jgi:hypothetical protein